MTSVFFFFFGAVCSTYPIPSDKDVHWIPSRVVAMVAKPPLLAVPKFRAASEEHCKGGYRQVCAKLCCWMLWRLKCIRTMLCMEVQQTYFRFSTQEFNMVGGYTEDPKKKQTQNWQNWGWALARDNMVPVICT